MMMMTDTRVPGHAVSWTQTCELLLSVEQGSQCTDPRLNSVRVISPDGYIHVGLLAAIIDVKYNVISAFRATETVSTSAALFRKKNTFDWSIQDVHSFECVVWSNMDGKATTLCLINVVPNFLQTRQLRYQLQWPLCWRPCQMSKSSSMSWTRDWYTRC